MKLFKLSVVALSLFALSACTRVETGEVGLRIGFDKQVKTEELVAGSLNQIIIGDVLTFPIKDVAVEVKDLTPLAKDNSTMKDMDMTIIYSINPKQVAELYIAKNKSFHAESKGDTYLMYNYIFNAARNAAYKAARKYDALDMSDNRASMEVDMRDTITRTLADEDLGGSLTIQQVLIRNITPADSVVASANELVRAKNEFKQKEVEVQTAKKEAERMNALAAQGSASIAYMNAQAALNISEGIKNGKVQTIVVPSNMTGLMIGK